MGGNEEHNSHATALFDPFSHSYNFDLVWSDPAQQPNYQSTLPAQSLLGPTPGPFTSPPSGANTPKPSTRPNQPALGVAKTPRKRTRASRRAPTTVLTTDTSNFRQMVQEFTGIPAPPFSTATSSSPYSGCLRPYYPFRPSAQKVTISNATPKNSSIATPITSDNIFSTPSGQINQVPNNSNSLQNQLLYHQSLMFRPSKSQGNSLGVSQDRINANFSTFVSERKGIERENNGVGVQENNMITTRNI